MSKFEYGPYRACSFYGISNTVLERNTDFHSITIGIDTYEVYALNERRDIVED